MNSQECIEISDEEESPTIFGTPKMDEPKNDRLNVTCMPEFVSVPSTSWSNMESELEPECMEAVPTAPNATLEGSCNFVEITKSELKKSIRKHDLVIKIDGTLNPSNVNAIMSVIQLYNFKNTSQIFFVKTSDPKEKIDVNDLICNENLSESSTDNANLIPKHSQKLRVFCKPTNLETEAIYAQPQIVVNRNPSQIVTATTTRHEKNQRTINKLNQYLNNKQKNHNKITLKPFDQICKISHKVVETVVRQSGCSNDLNEISKRIQTEQNIPDNLQQFVEKSRQVIETAINHTYNENIQQNPFNPDKSHQVSNFNPNMNLSGLLANEYDCVNLNNNDHMKYASVPNTLNKFCERTQNYSNLLENRANYEHIQQNPLNLDEFSPLSECSESQNLLKVSKITYCNDVGKGTKWKVKKCVKKPKSRLKMSLKSFYKQKYKLKEARIALSRSEVENYFEKRKLRRSLSFSEQNTSSNVKKKIFIHEQNFANMTHYFRKIMPSNTQLYFVNNHNITTSLYMKNFPLFGNAIKSNKIKVISKSTYKKYQPKEERKVAGLVNSLKVKRKTAKFCKFISDFHDFQSIEQNPLLKFIRLDHSYSIKHKL